ncbi:hypothetical protein [Siphonobacter sp. BAB-5385]|nr:hypothetical protein [Siphonobacter sp. BAB-5385]
MYRWLAQLLTFHFVCFCWIFFRADSMEIAQQLLHQIATQFDPTLIVQFVEGYQNVLLVMLLGYTLHFMPRSLELQAENWITRLPLVGKLAWLLAVILLMTQVQSAEVQPFIYFQF